MNPFSEISNLNWALDNIYTDDDAARADAREIIIELGLARGLAFAEYDDCDESNERLREIIRQRAREHGYGAWID